MVFKPTPAKIFIAVIVLLAVLSVAISLLLANRKNVAAPKPTPVSSPTPRPDKDFFRPQDQKASYNSLYLKQNVTINNVPAFIAIPASFIINNNQATGVVVKITDNNHFILESGSTVIPTVVSAKTIYMEYTHKPGTALNSPENFTANPLSGDQSKQIGQNDFLTVFYEEISATSSANMANWIQDNGHNFQAKQILLYEKN